MAAWIDCTDALREFLERGNPLIGLDTEFMRTDTFAPRLALVQIEVDGAIALIDPTADIDMQALAARLSDPGTVSVMHSASEDLDALAPILPLGLGTLFDTQIAAAFSGIGAGIGYQKLVAALVGVDLPKGETRSDWLQRPLTSQQLEYAAQDVLHLPFLHEELVRRMQARGFEQWHVEECARMLERARHREADANPQVAFRTASEWPLEQQARLRRLLVWRDATARRIDRPRPWILDDPRVLDFAARPPRDGEDLGERSKGLRALRSAERSALLALLAEPLRDDELEFTKIPPPATLQERRAITSLKEIVVARALELDLPEGLLCSRRHLETLWLTREWPAALEGWRKPLLHDALMARVHDA